MNGFENDDLLFRVDGHVATITLNRPDFYNAMSDVMRDGLRRAADVLRQNGGEIRVAVLTGAGKAFCSGGDMRLLKKRIDDGVSYRERLETYRRDVSDMVRELRSIRQPMIAKINGAAYGAGCSLAMICDVRIACESAKFGFPFGRRGLIPDWGATYFLPRILGLSRAISFCSTGRSFDAAEALRMGLVDEVAASEELDSRVGAFCEEILLSGPFSIMEAKAAMTRSLDLSMDAALEVEARVQSECFVSDDHREGVDSFLEKRPPTFTGK